MNSMALVSRIRATALDFVYLVCAVHLIVCIVEITAAPGSELWRIGSVEVSQTAQWINSSFCCVSIVSIIAAGVGALYLIERHLNIYFYVLALSALGDVAVLTLFILNGTSCKTLVQDAEIEKSSVDCKFTETGMTVFLSALIIFKLVGMAVVSKARKAIRVRYGEELLPHMKKSLQQSFREGDGGLGPAAGGDEDDAGAAAQPFAAAAAGPPSPPAPAGGEAGGGYGATPLPASRVFSLRPQAPLSAPTVAAAAPLGGRAFPSVGAVPAMRSAPAAVLAAQLPPAPAPAPGGSAVVAGAPPLRPVMVA